ncbi:MAG TPA: alpha-(1-_3)-arabinofuranosyltransferase family protein [Acidimicrobiales bacterium]|nr:alpha-(1->3)-arabinofuranosyltransferase family protein [Acidimicrobiales bacterium]
MADLSLTSRAPADSASAPPAEGGPGYRPPSRARSALDYAIFGLLAFIPMLATQPGTASDDTKTYLYLDPGRYLRQAISLWDPNIALGTVTHENIGYLLPMGPFYWVLAELHVPLWIAQRLWLGTILFAAGAGMIYLCRTIKLSGTGCYVASLAFMFTPYVLQYSGRISVILLPWAGLPWLLAFVILALRHGGWKYPALFALTVALVSGINASSILYVGIGPALWLPFAVFVTREKTLRQAWGVVWRIALLTALASLWWAVGLQVEAAYGVNILKYTETLLSTSSSSAPLEVLRGLGYWFFYGRSDQTGNWTQAAVAYTQQIWLLAATFAVPTLALLGSAMLKWRLRSFFALLVVVGMVLAVGANPYYHPTGVSGLIKAFMSDTTAGLALRSTDRASPLILLGVAVLLGAGVNAAIRRLGRYGLAIAAFAVAAVAAASTPLWTGATVVDGLHQPASPPPYVQQAAEHLNGTHTDTRVYALPGNNFAAYAWGDTIDTVYPGLLTRPFVTHEQQTMGSLPTADLLEAMDAPLQEGTLDPATIAPMASLMSAGDVLVQYDQAYSTYNTPNPLQLAQSLKVTPPGLSHPITYGTPRPNVSPIPHFSEQSLTRPANQAPTAPLVSYTVNHPRPIIRAESLSAPLIVAGNSPGLVDAASVGLLAGNPTIFYSGTLDGAPKSLSAKVEKAGANLVVTDTNRKQGFRWNGIQDNRGYTETAAQGAATAALVADPFNSPLDLFPTAPADAQSTTAFNGIAWVDASSYGTPTQYHNDERAAAALDGNLQTAWADSLFPTGQWWSVNFVKPHTIDSINLAQLQLARPRQVITKVTLTFDYLQPVTVELGPQSQTPAGQTIRFSPRSFTNLRITIDDSVQTKYHVAAGYQNLVGFAEVRIPGVDAAETVAMPQDLLRSVGSASIADPLTLTMNRLRGPGTPPRLDSELTLNRSFWLPTPRTFTLTGQARVAVDASDETVDRVLGRTSGTTAGVVSSSSSRVAGVVAATASAAADGNPSTMWEPGFGVTQQAGQWLQYSLTQPITFDALHLRIAADGRHSVPTAVTVSAGGAEEKVVLPAIADSRVPGSVVDVPVTLPRALTGQVVRITVDSVRFENTRDYFAQTARALPVGIAEVGIVGLAAPPLPADLPSTCRNDLLSVDGSPVWVSVQGPTAAALDRQPLAVNLCGPSAAGLVLAAGDHALASAWGGTAGMDIDSLALASAPGGAAATLTSIGQVPAPATGIPPSVTVRRQTATAMQLTVSRMRAGSAPFVLVLGQSINAGWVAEVGGHSLGSPILVDGFANGWQVDPAALASFIHHGVMTVDVRWAPQARVNVALVISAVTIVGCLLLAFLPRRRRSGDRTLDDSEDLGAQIGSRDRDRPDLVDAFRSDEPPTGWSRALAVAVVVGAVAGFIAPPLTGCVVGVATLIVLRVPRLRLVLGLVAAACVLAAGIYVIARQILDQEAANGGWPGLFGIASALAWAGVMFLFADAALELIQLWKATRVRRPHTPPDGVGPDSPVGGDQPDRGLATEARSNGR